MTILRFHQCQAKNATTETSLRCWSQYQYQLRCSILGCVVVVVDVVEDADVLVGTNGDLVVRNVGMTATHFANIY